MSSPRTGYSGLQIALHWIVAILVFGAYFTSEDMGDALKERIEQGLSGLDGATLHSILGGLAFAFILFRIVTRWTKGAPEPLGSPMMQMAAAWGHRLLYALMIAVPALGAATWYGKIEGLGDAHALLGNALILVAVAHLLVAIAHQALWADGTLARMVSPSSD
jgi:cytochrome b561